MARPGRASNGTGAEKNAVRGVRSYWIIVRHPPPSGWLDEPGRLKGGGVPSPYSNSLKPTSIVTGILVTDILGFDQVTRLCVAASPLSKPCWDFSGSFSVRCL